MKGGGRGARLSGAGAGADMRGVPPRYRGLAQGPPASSRGEPLFFFCISPILQEDCPLKKVRSPLGGGGN